MKKPFYIIVSLFIIIFVILSCNDDDLVVEDRITYERDILPIFLSKQASCGSAPNCHHINSTIGTTETYEGAKKMAESGRLIGSLEHRRGYRAMPTTLRRLSEGNINLVIQWIEDGILEK
jgi:hypothetical protein